MLSVLNESRVQDGEFTKENNAYQANKANQVNKAIELNRVYKAIKKDIGGNKIEQ